jgi:membrane protease YdiL (CAAX protease family)
VVMSGGVRAGSARQVVAFAAFSLMVGFAEEILLRGVALRTMLPSGVIRAVVLSSLFFGLGHLFNILQGRDLQSAIVQAIYATFIGIGFAGPRLYSGTILPAIFLHALIDFADQAVRGFVLAQPKPVGLRQAGVLVAITGLYALYGWWLARRSSLFCQGVNLLGDRVST